MLVRKCKYGLIAVEICNTNSQQEGAVWFLSHCGGALMNMHIYAFSDLEHDIFCYKIIKKKIWNTMCVRGGHKALGGRLAILREKIKLKNIPRRVFEKLSIK